MEHHFRYQITEKDEGKCVGDYLREKGYSRNILILLKQTAEGILVNHRPVHTTGELCAGDLLETVLAEPQHRERISAVPCDFQIVYEDEDLLVVNKPADMPVHPSNGNHEYTLANGLTWYYQEKGIPFTFRCINRLDRDTSGLLIIARHMLSAAILSEDMKKRRILRTYLGITEGNITHSGTITAPIARKEGSVLERCVDFENGEPAVTHYAPVYYQEAKNLTLTAFSLETGRTHQIRVHMKWLGHPLIGDFLYYPPERRNRPAGTSFLETGIFAADHGGKTAV